MTSSVQARAATRATPIDWRLQIPEERRRPLRAWFWTIAATTLAVLVAGGITRLTQSGLSIVDWNPLMGVIPPLTDAQWQATFERYQQYPEYRQLRQGMSLAEFRFIFFWEYVHRLLARMVGMVFLVPFIWFAAKRYFNRQLMVRALLLFGLGAMQGLMGWLMVKSGLVDRPSVSHFRLAAHLGLAFIIFGFALWLARDLSIRNAAVAPSATAVSLMRRGLAAVGTLLGLQIVWGAFVAGLDAGHYYPTFPLMGGRLVPRELLTAQPALLNFISNPIAVQWVHRVIGTALGVAVIVLFVRVLRARADHMSQQLNRVLLSLVLAQYLLGVLTLLLRVPVSLGVIHQATALIIFGTWLWWVHHVRNALGATAVQAG